LPAAPRGDDEDLHHPTTAADLQGNALLSEFAKSNGLGFLDATPWFCFENECPLVVGHTKDNNHVTSDYALQLPDLFRDGFRRALSD